MERREFNKLLTSGLVAVSFSGCLREEKATGLNGDLAHFSAALKSMSNPPLPEGKAIPFFWNHATLNKENPITLTWEKLPTEGVKSVWLRIASASDVRPRVQIDATLTDGEKVAYFDLQYGYMGQLFEAEIPIAALPKITEQGLQLRLTEGEEIWLFRQGEKTPTEASLLCPHLLLVKEPDPEKYWLDRLLSYNSIQFFGWAEGVTLDGIYEAASLAGEEKARKWFQNHFNTFLNEQDQFVYTGVHNQLETQRMGTVEGVLPFAVVAKFQPDHPTIDTIIEFCKSKANAEGVISDGEPTQNRHLASEANYTISYPLAVIAQQRQREDLYPLIAQTILGRKKWLTDSEGIYQRGRENTEEKIFKNWGRGVAWYVLGIARTLEHFPKERPEYEVLVKELQRSFDFIVPFQKEDGLFNVFLHEDETGTEVTGGAGIAAAVAVAKYLGITSSAHETMMMEAKAGLQAHFTPDGFLRNAVQHNAGGRALQVNGYRTISQYALGFYAILESYLKKSNT